MKFNEVDKSIMEMISQANYYSKQGQMDLAGSYANLAIATMMWDERKVKKTNVAQQNSETAELNKQWDKYKEGFQSQRIVPLYRDSISHEQLTKFFQVRNGMSLLDAEVLASNMLREFDVREKM